MNEPTTEQLRAELERVKQQLDAANRREAAFAAAIDKARYIFAESNSNDFVLQAKMLQPLEAALQPDAGTFSADCRATQKAALSQMSPGAGSADISQQANQPDAGSTGERLFTESQVRPLVDTLKALCDANAEYLPGDRTDAIEYALAHAKELGL